MKMNAASSGLAVYLATVAAFAFFIICPRMAAMTNIITRYSQMSIYSVVLWGTILSLPLLILTAWAIDRWGLMAGLGLAIFTDFLYVREPASREIKT